jgi:hypothetical protein
MAMRKYEITLSGTQPMIHHQDSIDWADQMAAWKDNKDNKKGSKAGDDRSPAHRWIGALYHNGKIIVIPTENIMRCFMEGGAMVPIPGGKNGKTFKSQTQSGIMCETTSWPLLIKDKEVPVAKILELVKEKDFAKHKEVVKPHGFELFLKRAKIGQAKHIRVRPLFVNWGTKGIMNVSDDQITTGALEDIAEMAGHYKGLGDWRPGGKTPGSYGMFNATVKQI